MPIKKTLDGRNIEFPEGYDTPEGREKIVAKRMPYSAKEDEYATFFILARGIIEELGGDDQVWKYHGEWEFNPSWEFQSKMQQLMPDVHEDTIIGRARVTHPLFSDLWLSDNTGKSNQSNMYSQITTVYTALDVAAKVLSNPNDIPWTDLLRQKYNKYFSEGVNLFRELQGRSTSPEDFEERCDTFEKKFNQSSFADYVKLPENWRAISAQSAIRNIGKSFKALDKEKVRRAIEKKQVLEEEKAASNLMQRVTEDGDITSIVREFDVQLNKTQDRFSLLLKLQKQFGNVPPDKKRVVVERFERNKLLSEYIKELYGWKCQICGFTFKQNNGRLYAETHHLEALSKGGKDSLDNIVVVCPNHHAMFDHADVSILNVTPEKISVMINGEQHVIDRILLQVLARLLHT